MRLNFSALLRSKVFWTAVIGILTSIGSACAGDVSWPTAVQSIFACLFAVFFRDTLAKQGASK